MKSIILVSIISCSVQIFTDLNKKMIVTSCVADLRYQPKANDSELKLPTSDQTNPLQITQLLLGEHVIAYEEFVDENNKLWLKVNAPQQQFYHIPDAWHGYPGWIQAKDAIEVEKFPKCNIVINQYTADIFDENNQTICTLSIGTRLNGTKINNDLWSITLPSGQKVFIKNCDVYFMSPIVQESIEDLRKSIVETSLKFLGNFYSWGGRSAQNDRYISSVDCSALVGLSFLAHGLQLPRMSHEQFLNSTKLNFCSDLQAGDLIFFVSITKHFTRMDHVMLYLGNNQFNGENTDGKIIEATFAQNHVVRTVSFQDRMGTECHRIASGDIVDDHGYKFYVYFASFLNDPAMIQTLRDNALNHEYRQTT